MICKNINIISFQ